MKKTVLLGVTSGISAFKSIELVKSLRKKGCAVKVIMTKHAAKMVSPIEFEKASGEKVVTDLFPKDFDYKKILKKRKVEHIELADSALVIAVVPATANIISKVAKGIANDLLSTTILASTASLFFAPSMNVHMWQNTSTKKNIQILKEKGHLILEPEEGSLACGYEGKGRLPEIEVIEKKIITLAEKRMQMRGMHVVVSAGGTEEPIDDIRVITNKSSGRMGIALAEECLHRGAKVTLIKARTHVSHSPHLHVKEARTVKKMHSELKIASKNADVIFHAAAVSDFSAIKEEKKLDSKKSQIVNLIPTKKIIDDLKVWNNKAFVVGFKAVTEEKDLKKKSRELLKRSKVDVIVGNNVSKHKFGGKETQVTFFEEKNSKKIKKADKKIVASILVDEVLEKISKTAFAPANISCIFETYKAKNPREKSSLGVGLTLDKGAYVTVRRSKQSSILINGKERTFPTVASVVKNLSSVPLELDITTEVPFGCGFGMSGACALAAAYAINALLRLKKTRKELAMIAHVSEVENETGLGDVAAQFHGGILMRRQKKAPLDVEALLIPSKTIYYKAFGPISTEKVLGDSLSMQLVNRAGKKAMKKIHAKLSFEELLRISKDFSYSSGLATKKVKKAIDAIEKKGGCASMIMLGESVFSNISFPGSKESKIVKRGAYVL